MNYIRTCLRVLLFLLLSLQAFLIISCSSSQSEREREASEKTVRISNVAPESEAGASIIAIAKSEQQNSMYSRESDSANLYWTGEYITGIEGNTKCNIYALNVLFKAGFKTPEVNALCQDLYDTNNFVETLPVVSKGDITKALKGDLVISPSHVLIFDSLEAIEGKHFVLGWWAGTGQKDDGNNIINNVCHGMYQPGSDFILRRPLKK